MQSDQNIGTRPMSWLALPFATGWRHRELIRVIVRREFAQRFRGAALGWIWAIIGPIVMLGAYTIVFTGPFKVSSAAQAGVGHYALFIFAALIPFNLFTELFARAPNLMRENAWFLKKTIFPSDTLGWIALCRALIYAGISFTILLAFELAIIGTIPATVLLVPLVIVPYCLFLLGVVWFFAALGSLTQDVAHIVTSIMPLLIFGTPVFYGVADVPEAIRGFAYYNPLAIYVEMTRGLSLAGVVPDLLLYGQAWLVALATFWIGHAVFMRYRSILVDVV
jgi:lipopolysaccharide transport system permease protein